jgi:transcriptional regulator with XRE-family HTH domain
MGSFGENLKAARLAKKMTLVQCADALGITNPALSQWEQDKREPKYSMLLAICHLLDTTPNDLLGISALPPAVSVIGNGNAVAQGAGARAVVTSKAQPGEMPQCAKCPIKKQLAKVGRIVSGK